jgi:hypothetical protein
VGAGHGVVGLVMAILDRPPLHQGLRVEARQPLHDRLGRPGGVRPRGSLERHRGWCRTSAAQPQLRCCRTRSIAALAAGMETRP